MFVIMTSLGIYIREKNKESRLVFWAALICICGGLTGLQVILEREFLQYISQYGSQQIILIATFFVGLLNFFINTFPYFSILIFFLIYNSLLQQNNRILVALSLPLWITLVFFTDLPTNNMNELMIAIWGVFYVVAAFGLAIRPIIIEKNIKQRMYHSAIAFIFIVPLISLNAYHFIPNPYSNQILLVIPVICIGSILLILFLFIRGTFLGLKRKSVQTVHLGTTLIHHSLKNSIGKIKLNALNIKKGLNNQQFSEIEGYVDTLLKTHDTMMKTMAQVSHAVNDKLNVHREEHNLSEVLDEVAKAMEVFPNIRVEKQYFPIKVSVDRSLFTECLINICNNAIEAMREYGTIHINLEGKKRVVVLSISDTGPGMDTIQLQNVFEPFYSTKQRTGRNFGLGMYQVKKVMEAHKGRIEVKSKIGQGTTIKLIIKRWEKESVWGKLR
ncbi:sensor histidine kinase [Bacillus massilinigeriensis]|uniref:sensor histidine kinase n=1 Tax=Bacillus massilionigeriensis TaxID=1805475 RepID=UPI00096B498D|nr:sensor histidine kinase [Bacillus massilionigeriensis]